MKEMFLENGFDDFVSKPIDIILMNSVLEKWIPKYKQIGSISDRQIPVSTAIEPADVPQLENVDTMKGIHLSGGTIEYYLETLATFHEDGQERMNKIRQSVEKDDLPMFVIHVHALKSASANIGAGELSKAAYILEQAGQSGELPYVKDNCAPFLVMLERLLKNIDSLLASSEESENEADDFDKDMFLTELNILKKAIGDMDGDSINEAIELLLRSPCPHDIKSTIRKISSHLLMTEYDEAEELIETLLV
jgi:HPt (histidine-containing phosphotransfer) domain-containing protein